MANNSPRRGSEDRSSRTLLRVVAIALLAAVALSLVALDGYGVYLREARQHVFVQVFNLDDGAIVRVNGAHVLHAGHGEEVKRDLGWLANSDRIETRFVNRGGTYTWGVRISDAEGELDLDTAGIIDGVGADGNTSFESDALIVVHCREILADGTSARNACGTAGGAQLAKPPPIPAAESFRDRLVVAVPPLTAFLLFSALLAVVWVLGRRLGLPYHRVIERGLALLAVATMIVAATNALFGV